MCGKISYPKICSCKMHLILIFFIYLYFLCIKLLKNEFKSIFSDKNFIFIQHPTPGIFNLEGLQPWSTYRRAATAFGCKNFLYLFSFSAIFLVKSMLIPNL